MPHKIHLLLWQIDSIILDMYEINKRGFWWVLEISSGYYDLIELLRWQLKDYPGCKKVEHNRWHFKDYPTAAEHIITLLLLKSI